MLWVSAEKEKRRGCAGFQLFFADKIVGRRRKGKRYAVFFQSKGVRPSWRIEERREEGVDEARFYGGFLQPVIHLGKWRGFISNVRLNVTERVEIDLGSSGSGHGLLGGSRVGI
ncbi:hypothetical protein HAX54_030287 [Datura stramonium]|uniref:Uncharacterized protein n=1 Tax=Datura stramonium TaxID=4076 RepID=A0ABS8VAC7_DATST|nr:hypothetical protein [Datura stramonium]